MACILALAGYACLFFWHEIFQGMALFPASSMAGDPRNYFLGDQYTQVLPWRILTARSLQAGVVPQWNPLAGLGTPFLAGMQPGVFYPLNLLVLALPIAQAAGARAALSLFFASTGMLLYLRKLRLRHAAAMLGALTFGFCSIQVAWTGATIGAEIIWLPWLMLGVEALAETPCGLWFAYWEALWAITLLGGNPESIAYLALFVAAYAAYRVARLRATHSWQRAVRRGGYMSMAFVLGLALSAVQVLPTLLYLPASATAALRSGAGIFGWDQVTGSYTEMLSTITLLLPDFFGNPTRGPYWLFAPTYIDYSEAACYVGTIVAVMVLSGLWRRGKDGPATFFLAAAVITGGVAFGWPVIGGLRALPIMRTILPGRLRLEMDFCLAALAALSAQHMADVPVSELRRSLTAGLRRYALLVLFPTGLAATALLSPRTIPAMRGAVDMRTLLPLVFAAGLALLAAWCRPPLPYRAFLAGLIALEAVDLFLTGASYNPAVPANHVLPEIPAIRLMQARSAGFRVATIDPLPPNVLEAYGVEEAGDYDPAVPDQLRLFDEKWLGRDLSDFVVFAKSDQQALSLPVADLLSIKFVWSPVRLPALAQPRWQVTQLSDQYVYENRRAQPEATIVSALECVATDGQELAAATSPAFDPRRIAVTVCEHDPRSGARRAAAAAGVVLSYSRPNVNSVSMHVRVSRSASLVLSQQYVDGWTMRTGTRSLPMFRCDAILQCVRLQPGDWHLSATYEAPGLALGIKLSASAAALLVATLAFAVVNRVTRRATPPNRTVSSPG
jgi:hypothetical protein